MFDKKVYAVKHKSEDVVQKSSSGGAFTALSDEILKRDGIIIGAKYNFTEQRLEHVIAKTTEERDHMRGSKYIWSDLGNVFKNSIAEIEHGKWVLFVGTPCQAAAYRNFLRTNHLDSSNVVICDIVCHGTPTEKLWSDYVEYFQKKYKKKIDNITFRDKRNGWAHPSTFAYCGNDEISIADYTDLYYSKCALQERCYSCKYANLDRPGDITIGDFWGIEKIMPDFCDNKGVSLVIINTLKGDELFNSIVKDLHVCESNLNECLQPNLCAPTNPSPNREKFLSDYEKHGTKYVIRKYTKSSLYGKIKNKMVYILKH